MDDIVERLREGPGDWQQEAADEIERLRSDIRDMAATIEGQVGTVIGLQTEIEKLQAVQEAQQRELVIRAHNQTRHLEEVQKLRAEIDALQRLVQREQAEVYRLSTVFIKPGERE